MVGSSRMGTWTCFYQTVVIMEIGRRLDQSLLRWKRESVHGTIDKTFCAENIVHYMLRTTGQNSSSPGDACGS